MVDLRLIKPEHLWYVVGFVATDGSLSSDGRHIDITSKERQHLKKILESLGLKNKIGKKYGGSGTTTHRIQMGDVQFYRFLEEVGLTPRKSLLLGRVKVPRDYFVDFLRGVIDGDGNIRMWVHPSNKNVQWALRIYSAAPVFARWLKQKIENSFGIRGRFHVETRRGRENSLYQIKFGKFASKTLLRECYYKNCLALDRKLKKARKCLQSEDKLSRYGNVVADWGEWRNWQTREA